MSQLEETLIDILVAEGLPMPEREVVFHRPRRWRIDLGYPEYKVAVEVEGGTFARMVRCQHCQSLVMTRTKQGKFIPLRVGGRHNTGAGMEGDIEKYNQLALDGWMLVRISSKMIKEKGGVKAITAVKIALILRGWTSDEHG